MASEKIYWLQPDGTIRDLMDIPNVGVLVGRSGFDMPPVEHVTDRVPLRAGARHRTVLTGPRSLDLPLHFEALTYEAFRTKLRDIEAWFYPDPRKGAGKLRVVSPLGDTREITCWYESGLQGNEAVNAAGLIWRDVVITLYAPDPFWYDSAPTVANYTLGTPAVFFPLLPIKLTRVDIFSSAVANNPGDVEAWPVWTLTGPMTGVVLTNKTPDPDQVVDMTYTLLAGETITIDTREDKRTVVKNDGTNLYGNLTAASYLWPLQKGANEIQIQMAGATADSKVNLSFQARYIGV